MSDLIGLIGFGDKGWGFALLGGAIVTVEVAASAYLLGLAIGLLGAAAKLRGGRIARGIAETYTTVVRGLPEILLILFVYYGGTSAVRGLAGLIAPGVTIEIDAFAAGVASLGLISGAYSTEVFRGAILAVASGQREAAQALGLGRWLVFRKVVLPQALAVGMPALGNLWLVTLKDSALISVVGLRDLVGIAASGAAFSRQPFTFYMVVALIFLTLSLVSMLALGAMERRLTRGRREG